MQSEKSEQKNLLGNESSLYLQQHALNPVHWHAWNEEAWQRARAENKLVLVSIGYSSCHWCHVMEHESFENSEVAALMNEHFVCIKVDREERPDVDHVYMEAVQLMTGSGGWPLNCFCLPNGSPFYGGTYFQRQQWLNVLRSLQQVHLDDPQRIQRSAQEAVNALRSNDLQQKSSAQSALTLEELMEAVQRWSRRFDLEFGGELRAPKFPLPDNLRFLLRFSLLLEKRSHAKLPSTLENLDFERSRNGYKESIASEGIEVSSEITPSSQNKAMLNISTVLRSHIDTTLQAMAFGGIFDHLSGGFARYSTDVRWKVPHFEKMLYDNAQLISLYSEAFRSTQNPLYKDVIVHTIHFIKTEMMHSNGCFYSSIDADSEGEEGRYYVWTEQELRDILQDDFEVFALIYSIKSNEIFEHDRYILFRSLDDETLAKRLGLTVQDLQQLCTRCLQHLHRERQRRIPPATDTKIIVSWNALMVQALIDAYKAVGTQEYLDDAVSCAQHLLLKARSSNNELLHVLPLDESQRDKMSVGFLEDYSALALACIDLYEQCADPSFLDAADSLCAEALHHFEITDSPLLQFRSKKESSLITQTIDVQDNVIPSSNAMMANALYRLGVYRANSEYRDRAWSMLESVQSRIVSYPSAWSHWSSLLLRFLFEDYTAVIVGADIVATQSRVRELQQRFIPNLSVAWTTQQSSLPLLADKPIGDKSLIYLCDSQRCQAPVESVKEMLDLLNV